MTAKKISENRSYYIDDNIWVAIQCNRNTSFYSMNALLLFLSNNYSYNNWSVIDTEAKIHCVWRQKDNAFVNRHIDISIQLVCNCCDENLINKDFLIRLDSACRLGGITGIRQYMDYEGFRSRDKQE